MARRIIKQEKASRKPVCFPFKYVNRFINLFEKIIAVKVAFPVFPCLEEQPRLPK